MRELFHWPMTFCLEGASVIVRMAQLHVWIARLLLLRYAVKVLGCASPRKWMTKVIQALHNARQMGT